MRSLVLIASLTACDSSGIEVVVAMPDEGGLAPDRVRLYIGQQVMPRKDATTSIGPPGFSSDQERTGFVWLRDKLNADDVMKVTNGEPVSFGFRAEGDPIELGAIVAVGFTGNVPTSVGSLFHVTTGEGHVFVHTIQLHPVPAQELEVVIWGPEDRPEACVHVSNRRADRDDRDPRNQHENVFLIAAENDRDCDGLLDDNPLECTASTYLGSTPPAVEDVTCALRTPATGGNSYCMLGGPACTDGQPAIANQCAASNYCVPSTVCAVCDNTDPLDSCYRAPYQHSQVMFGIKCHVSTVRIGSPVGPAMLCQDPLPVAGELLLPGSTATCTDARITSIGQPWTDRLAIGQMRFGIAVSSACQLEVKPEGELIASPPPPIDGLVAVTLDPGRSLAVPIRFILDPPDTVCVTSQGCTFINENNDDRATACLTDSR